MPFSPRRRGHIIAEVAANGSASLTVKRSGTRCKASIFKVAPEVLLDPTIAPRLILTPQKPIGWSVTFKRKTYYGIAPTVWRALEDMETGPLVEFICP